MSVCIFCGVSGNKLAKGPLLEPCKIFDVEVIFAGFFGCAFTECKLDYLLNFSAN